MQTDPEYTTQFGMSGISRVMEALLESREEETDPSPYCQYCGAMRETTCTCGPIVDNN